MIPPPGAGAPGLQLAQLASQPVNPLEDYARQVFWQAQVPLMILPGEPAGVRVMTDFGEVIHFPDQTSIEFFMIGYRLAEHNAAQEAPANPYETMLVPSQVPEDQGGE